MITHTSQPLVSVLMPVKNALPYLEEAINSILNQTMSNFELLLINDHSNDGSYQYLSSLNDPRIKLHSLSKSTGVVSASNYGIKHSRGKYIARMDADDIADTCRFEQQVQFLEENNDYVLVASNISTIFEKGFKKHAELLEKWYNTAHSDCEIEKQFFLGNCINHPSSLYRRQAAIDCGLYQEGFTGAADYEFLLRLKTKGMFYKLSEKLLKYRIHPAQVSQRKIHNQRLTDAHLKVKLLKHKKLLLNKDIVLIGAGPGGELILNELIRQNLTCHAIIDNDRKKWGTKIRGVTIIGGEDLIQSNLNYFFIIASSPGRSHFEMLLNKYNLIAGIDYQALWF